MLTQLPGNGTKNPVTTPGQNPALVYLASLPSEQSKRTMRSALNNLAVLNGARPAIQIEPDKRGRPKRRDVTYLHYDWSGLRGKHTTALRTKLGKMYKPATANKILSALRGVLEATYRLGQITAEEYQQAIKVKGLKNRAEPAGRDLSIDEVTLLVDACKQDKSPAGRRDMAMIAVWYSCGIRRTELVGLTLADFDPTSGRLEIRNSLGRKIRTVYVANGALLALQSWLIARGLQAGPLFSAINKAGKLLNQRISPQAVYARLKKRAAQAGLTDLSPHDFRRTFVSDMLDRGVDASTVARLAGYANITSTLRYDQRTEETKRRVAGLTYFPF
jgi:site-specific recombinase XerD